MTKNARGFSFIEMMMVVAIGGVIAGMGAYTLTFSQGNRLSVQRADMMEALEEARGIASSRAECVRVRFDGDIMITEVFAAAAGRRCVGPFLAPLRTLRTIDFAQRGATLSTFTGGATEIMFNTSGGLVNDRLTTFTVSYGDKTSTFRIYPAIGQIRAQ